ncbi:LOW QUALITY PROTEIN: hypothetical protein Smp_124790 [Schistosoma mansoni]|nr:LOW QUALITY PROTEIN: hypothetical protein Smp_124790 [Schistosoma mansoni]|eukprot:XP_018644116.1 LOW QUALITY PROTEIN: hypothetical protein Smp_124790 [Schistosoma mansoni]
MINGLLSLVLRWCMVVVMVDLKSSHGLLWQLKEEGHKSL